MSATILAIGLLAICAITVDSKPSKSATTDVTSLFVENVWEPHQRSKRQLDEHILEEWKQEQRIANGKGAMLGEFPHQALLKIRSIENDMRLCGGSLVSHHWILTAAHCAVGAKQFDVTLGGVAFNGAEAGRLNVKASIMVIHPEYNPLLSSNDVALIKLPDYVKYTDNIQPIKLAANHSNKFLDEYAVASGWGQQYTDAKNVANHLQWAVLRVVSQEDCVKAYDDLVIKDFIICAQGTFFESTCRGDSGIALI